MNKDLSIKRGERLAQRITQQYAKTFYFASRFLPAGKRYSAYVVYAVCRLSDEAVDNPEEAPLKRLSRIRENIEMAFRAGPLQEDLLRAFRQTITRFGIPKV